jgi:hypothetical protein
LACALVVQKYYSDFFYSNGSFSECTGADLTRLNAWELEILKTLDFNLKIEAAEIEDQCILLSYFIISQNLLELKNKINTLTFELTFLRK